MKLQPRSSNFSPFLELLSKWASSAPCFIISFLCLLAFYSLNIQISKAEETEEQLLPIEAASYDVKILARSNSNRLYLLDDLSGHQPYVGHILLLKNKLNEPVMALRVLKTYPEDKMIAAKQVKKYLNVINLEESQAYTVVEKISDIIPPHPLKMIKMISLK